MLRQWRLRQQLRLRVQLLPLRSREALWKFPSERTFHWYCTTEFRLTAQKWAIRSISKPFFQS